MPNYVKRLTLFILCLVLVSFSNSLSKESKYVKVLQKKQRTTNQFPLSTKLSFEMFLRSTDMVIDKSLLLKQIVDELYKLDNVAFTAPRRWGKTSVLRMIQFFFQPVLCDNLRVENPNLTSSYNYFTNGSLFVNDYWNNFTSAPLISAYPEIIDRYVAQHPVLLLDFTDLSKVASYQNFVDKVRMLIYNQVHVVHKDVMRKICVEKINSRGHEIKLSPSISTSCKEFEYITEHFDKETVSEERMKEYLSAVVSLLYFFYGKPVVVLIDDYDGVLRSSHIPRMGETVLSDEDKTKILSLNIEILKRLSKISVDAKINEESVSASNPYFMTILTGILPLNIECDDSQANAINIINYIDERIWGFFGIPVDIAHYLMRNYGKFNTTACDICIKNYGGYQVLANDSQKFFNPYSLLHAVTTNSLDFPWKRNEGFNYPIYVIFENSKRKNDIEELVNHKCQEFGNPTNTVDITLLAQIGKDARRGLIDENMARKHFFDYLHHTGYLTIIDKTEIWNRKASLYEEQKHAKKAGYCFKIANLETKSQITEVLYDYKVIPAILRNAGVSLLNLIEDHKISAQGFVDNLKLYLQNWFKNKHFLLNTEKLPQWLLTDVAEYIADTHDGYRFAYDYKFNVRKDYPDILVGNSTHAGIVQIKCNWKGTLPFDQAYHEQLLRHGVQFRKTHPEVKFLRLILMHVKEKKSATPSTEIEFKEFKCQSPEDYLAMQSTYDAYCKKKDGSKRGKEKENMQKQRPPKNKGR